VLIRALGRKDGTVPTKKRSHTVEELQELAVGLRRLRAIEDVVASVYELPSVCLPRR
jgi:CHAD domain-containing protein